MNTKLHDSLCFVIIVRTFPMLISFVALLSFSPFVLSTSFPYSPAYLLKTVTHPDTNDIVFWSIVQLNVCIILGQSSSIIESNPIIHGNIVSGNNWVSAHDRYIFNDTTCTNQISKTKMTRKISADHQNGLVGDYYNVKIQYVNRCDKFPQFPENSIYTAFFKDSSCSTKPVAANIFPTNHCIAYTKIGGVNDLITTCTSSDWTAFPCEDETLAETSSLPNTCAVSGPLSEVSSYFSMLLTIYGRPFINIDDDDGALDHSDLPDRYHFAYEYSVTTCGAMPQDAFCYAPTAEPTPTPSTLPTTAPTKKPTTIPSPEPTSKPSDPNVGNTIVWVRTVVIALIALE